MTLAAHGTKRKCLSCGATFFDLQRNPIVCPKCEAVFTVAPLPRRHIYERQSRAAAPASVSGSGAAPERDPEAERDEEDSEAAEHNPDDVESDAEPDDDILPLE